MYFYIFNHQGRLIHKLFFIFYIVELNLLFEIFPECQCNQIGTFNSSIEIDGVDDVISCDIESGECDCKPGVGGRRCDRCLKGFWGFGDEGCTKCECERCEQVR